MNKDRSFQPTAKEVREFRESHDLSMNEAVRVLKKVKYMEACQEAKTVQDLAEILFRIVEDKF